MGLTTDEWRRLIEERVIDEGDACELHEGVPARKGSTEPYVFSPDQVARAGELGIDLRPSWFDAILARADLRREMERRLLGDRRARQRELLARPGPAREGRDALETKERLEHVDPLDPWP